MAPYVKIKNKAGLSVKSCGNIICIQPAGYLITGTHIFKLDMPLRKLISANDGNILCPGLVGIFHLCLEGTCRGVALTGDARLTQGVDEHLHGLIRCRIGAGDKELHRLLLREGDPKAVHDHHQPLDAAAKAEAGHVRTAKLTNQTVIPATAANGSLGTDIFGYNLPTRLGVLIKATDDVGIALKINAHGGQVTLHGIEMHPALIAQIIHTMGCSGGDCFADIRLAVEDAHGVLFKS